MIYPDCKKVCQDYNCETCEHELKHNKIMEFFETNGKYNIHANYYECDNSFTVEELYQNIKNRLKYELKIN